MDDEPSREEADVPEATFLRVLFHTDSPLFADLMENMRRAVQYTDTGKKHVQ